MPEALPSEPKPKRVRHKPHLVNVGSIAIPVYRTRWRKKASNRVYQQYVIIWRDAAGRHREKRNTLARAEDRARTIGTNILNGQTAQNQFTEADRARYLHCLEQARSQGKSLELLVTEAVESQKLAGSGQSVSALVRFAKEHQPKDVVVKSIPALVDDLLAEKRRLAKSDKWLGTLTQQLKRFATQFDCPLHLLRASEITAWLDGLRHASRKPNSPSRPIGLRTRKNYYAAMRELVKFAQAKGQLSRTWEELQHIEDAPVAPVEVEIYTPDQLLKLMVARQALEDRGRSGATLIPFLALQAWAGIRHEEMHQRGGAKPWLDWSNIDLAKGIIKIKATVGKTKKLRLITMHPNLVAWLTPYAKPSGPICDLNQTAGALDRTKKLARIPNRRGQLTNALRASFISYRLAETNDIGLTSREAGNSPKVIQENYLELATAADAQRWFSIVPNQAEILPLFAWGKRS